MQLSRIWIRFYKSFNFDYELKAHPDSTERSWELTSDGWRPYVIIPLEPDITAVVGANESGKTHLLDAISIALTGSPLRKRDFCRYSSLFSVESGKRLYPNIGASFKLDKIDTEAFSNVGVPLQENGELLILRREPGVLEVLSSDGVHLRMNEIQTSTVNSRMPFVHRLDTQVDLPDSVSIASLAETEIVETNRKNRMELLRLLGNNPSADAITAAAATILTLVGSSDTDAVAHDAKQGLAHDLLTKIAKIDKSSFVELQQAIAEEREGLVNGLIQEMNRSIRRHLNISRWWTQDENFELRVSPREHELVFTIRDRTGTEYSFSERSRGLTYFLSYYVQLRSHHRPTDRPEVLLMDEPDAYLSAVGQQDLLRVLENHAYPDNAKRADQVVYVTHSPFLIDKNAGHRVRVVDKGTRDEGTRLVKNVTQNHYEPLRTSLGAAVAETAFIGGDNLFVEGISDQMLLTGMNARLLRAGTPPSQCLDLNKVTIVPGGSNVPYMLYLARGRDQYKPACAVLLDSDKTGREARAAIRRGGARGKPTVSEDLVVMLGEWASNADLTIADGVRVEEPEDLVPLRLAGVASRRYAQRFLGISKSDASKLTDALISSEFSTEVYSLWDCVESAFEKTFQTSIGKAGFAKELLSYVSRTDDHGEEDYLTDEVDILTDNYAKLLRKLANTLLVARDREDANRRDQRIDRIISAFVEDHSDGAIKDSVTLLMNRLDSAADSTPEGDVIRAGTSRLRREFDLDNQPLSSVEPYGTFLNELTRLPQLANLTGQGHLNAVASAASSSGVPTTGTAESVAVEGSAKVESTATNITADELAASIDEREPTEGAAPAADAEAPV